MKKRFLLAIAATLALSTNVFAAEINITANGIPIKTTAAPFSQGGVTFVPIRAISEALGSDAAWDASKGIVTIKNDGLEIILRLNETTAQVNGNTVEMPVASTRVNDSVMVPVRFVAETLNSYVQWKQGDGEAPSEVKIYSKYPTKTESGVSISSYWQTDQTKLSGDETAKFEQIVPQFSGFSDAAKQDSINKDFSAPIDESFGLYKKEVQDMLGGSDPYSIDIESNYDFMGADNGVLQIGISGYEYTGGAHGIPNKQYMLYDVANSKQLYAKDLFKESAVESGALEKSLRSAVDNVYKNGTPERSKEDFEGVANPFADGWSFDALSSFYIKDGNFVLVYAPYVLASYGEGFIEFPVPMSELQDVLAEPYNKLKF